MTIPPVAPTDSPTVSPIITGSQKFWGRLVSLLTAGWLLLVTFIAQMLGWVGPALGIPLLPEPTAVWASLAAGVAIGLPLLLWVARWRTTRYRAIFQTWLLAAGFLLLLAPTRWLFPTQSQTILLCQSGLMVLYGLWLRRRNRRQGATAEPATALFQALAAAALVAYPWIAWGSLGSPLDIVLNIGAGALFGWVTGLLLRAYWLPSLAVDSRGPARDLFTGGFVTGIALLIMASGFSFNGVQLLLMLTLPALGWVAVGLSAAADPGTAAPRWRNCAWLIGVATAIQLLLIDPDGVTLLAQDGLLRWSFQAAGTAMGIGWLLGLLALLARKQLPHLRPSWPALLIALLLWAGGGALYLRAGTPGLYGDRLFVILNEQADLTQANTITDRHERRRFVYATLVQQAESSQTNLRQTLERVGVSYTPYYLVNAIEVRGGLLLRWWLATRPEVDRVLPSPALRPLPAPETVATGSAERPERPQWNLTQIGADKVWQELSVTGEGIVIGQSDSGVQVDHPEFSAAYRGRNGNHDYNWFDPWNQSQAPTDIGGHGTHTLGSVLGKTVGVAPGATWFACANLARNLGNPARYLDCLQFMLAPFPLGGDPFRDGDPAQAADVLNNSWGCPEEAEGCDATSLLPAVRALRAAGIFVVASAGNEGPACSTIDDAIALYDEVFAVGASDEAGNLALFSSTGPVTVDGSGRIKPDILAPGVRVLSAFPNSSYEVTDGTSMAGPHVAGVVALVWSANPTLMGDIDRTEQILIDAATPFTGTLGALADLAADETAPSPPTAPTWLDQMDAAIQNRSCLAQTDTAVIPNNVAGYGVLNAYKAVQLARGQ
ncbi:MAG: peptidase S8 [Caldilinea sp. CFX5]|nr:peptidase S8 [Caldilinea sp. CFX5]